MNKAATSEMTELLSRWYQRFGGSLISVEEHLVDSRGRQAWGCSLPGVLSAPENYGCDEDFGDASDDIITTLAEYVDRDFGGLTLRYADDDDDWDYFMRVEPTKR
jgi:hypothetical protein